MDEKYFKIVEVLRRNGRIPKSKIAIELGVSEAAIRKRIKRLEEKGVILGYKAVIDYRKLNMVCSYTGVEVEPQHVIDVMKNLRELENVTSLYLTSGDHDFIAEILCRDVEELEEVHSKISKFKGVKRVCPAIVTEPIKL